MSIDDTHYAEAAAINWRSIYTGQTKPRGNALGQRIIMDSDYGPDVDDLVAHCFIHGLANLGECQLIASIACISNAKSPGAIRAVDTWHGRPAIPVGGNTTTSLFPNGGQGGESDGDAWAVSLYDASATYPRNIDTTNYPDALPVYRQALADSPDGSVKIVTIGMLNELSRLLDSPGDGIDARNGQALVAAKVESVFIMGGRNSGQEFNMRHAPAAANNVAATCPVPIYWSQFEVGLPIFTGKWSGSERAGHILRYGLEAFNHNPGSDGDGRQSWDAMNVLAAVRGASAGFSFAAGTMAINASSGASTWTADAEGPHYRASKTKADAEYETDIEPLIWHAQST